MRNSVFYKSIIRQPIRVVLIALLIVAASFIFVLSVTEYAIVTEQITKIGSYYRTIAGSTEVM